jgi:hypothetical protein
MHHEVVNVTFNGQIKKHVLLHSLFRKIIYNMMDTHNEICISVPEVHFQRLIL